MKRILFAYTGSCIGVGAVLGLFAGFVCAPIGMLWALARFVWGW